MAVLWTADGLRMTPSDLGLLKKRPRDRNQFAKFIVDVAVGIVDDRRLLAAGRAGGLKGGKARAAKLTRAERSAIALAAAEKRWSK